MTSGRATCSGPLRTWAGWSATYIVYAPLLTGATTVLYEGKPVGTPDAGAFWRVVSEHGVKALFTAPTAIRAIRKEDPDGAHLKKYDISRLRYLFLAGERLDPDTYHWASEKLGIPVVDHWWQTETGWAIAANPLGVEPLPLKAGSPTVPMPGYDVRVLHVDGSGCEPGEEGVICLRLPLPPGTLSTLWGDDARFEASYLCEHPGYYLTGDGGYLDEDGYLFVMGRIDDVINVAGHRLSTGAIEAVLAAHPAVAECAVIGVADPSRVRFRGASLCSRPAPRRRSRRGAYGGGARRDRCGRVLQAGRCRLRAAEDSLGEDPPKRCAASPTARMNPCRRRSRTLTCSTRCGHCYVREWHAACERISERRVGQHDLHLLARAQAAPR